MNKWMHRIMQWHVGSVIPQLDICFGLPYPFHGDSSIIPLRVRTFICQARMKAALLADLGIKELS